MDLALQNKIVAITGCNGGIGVAATISFLKEGAKVVGLYRESISKLSEIFTRISELGLNEKHFMPIEVDINSTTSIQEAIKKIIAEWGQIDVLVNNAGATLETPFLALNDDDFESIYVSNFSSLAKVSREVGKIMMRQKFGNIINVSSLVSERFGRGVSVYAAMKAAVNRLTEVMALEMGKKNIRVNAVCPGVVETSMSNALQERHGQMLIEQTPLRRFASPEEVAHSILFLSSEATASFITGSKLFIDGGIRL
ncbi:MAG: hypothetical protein A2504_11355 [Bdellovibrionales bacterium RIFOXYD12_FULL_39_22]|nr:MAG: hypothetical protein A2385_09920 [Bdellovibrionales bacterium RIFOXYB1_FULL_39_21]OFZ44268.1 MAG: hypothetical protein A2485_07540 [Bdellovibrionales bacterium RIFOXYC12_FULL_39_17]OFZ46810.1 MAG: hypothetical protein A2404_04775 [Bdellovibrionales bacterium RIFOXYC1_FULL_39_130]OFZ71002.1 MAG: hypothetical protein A2451_00275 [Bdellovibrionales bacterium RIFOXYC2_FULL_39_8]OFZ75913.1 MAG: hypothetical protein A2560_02375 [Bdellovibrionales bacterium RIFOXYD1_FULL_39_84]OFZ95489.1 MAG: